MKIIILLALIFQERATLTTPVVLGSVTDYQVTGVYINTPKTIGTPSGDWVLNISYTDNKDNNLTDNHVGVVSATNPNGADVLVKALNKADLSIKSLNRRALEHLVSEGKIPASAINGTPQ